MDILKRVLVATAVKLVRMLSSVGSDSLADFADCHFFAAADAAAAAAAARLRLRGG